MLHPGIAYDIVSWLRKAMMHGQLQPPESAPRSVLSGAAREGGLPPSCRGFRYPSGRGRGRQLGRRLRSARATPRSARSMSVPNGFSWTR